MDLIEAGTLVVVPKSVLDQWQGEIKKHVMGDCLSYYSFYEVKSREGGELHLYDIVFTTYSIVGIDAGGGGILKGYYWHRIILDEGHLIKRKENLRFRSLMELNSRYRWCLSGTPLQNKFDDLYSIIKFLGLEVFEDY
jgi:DNA repair protein RAD5